MPETQNTEYKSSWHDEYLKWICGYNISDRTATNDLRNSQKNTKYLSNLCECKDLL